MKLTKNQEKFAQLVFQGKTQSDAYREAYPKSVGWLAKSVHEKSSELAANIKVKSRIEELQSKVTEKLAMTQVEAQNYLAKIVTTPPCDIDETSPLCQGKKETKYGSEILIPNKLGALDQLAKQSGWYDQPEININVGVFSQLVMGDGKRV